MAAKTWETDFRSEAIRASIQKLGPEFRSDPFRYDGSFCLPVAERPIVGWSPGKISLIALAIGFALMGVGAWLATTAERGPGDPDPVLLTFACLSSLSGFAMFFVPVKGDQMILRWLIGERAGDKLMQFDREHTLSSELSPPGIEGQKLSIDGDDHVLIFFDDANRRLLIEGIGARYQIRGEDVLRMTRYGFMNYVGVELDCRIDERARLRIALARVSLLTEMINQVPIFAFLRKRLRNPLHERCERALQPDAAFSSDIVYDDVEFVD